MAASAIRHRPSESRSESATGEPRWSSVHPLVRRRRVRSEHSAARRSSRIEAWNAHRRSGSNPDRRASAAASEDDDAETNESHSAHLCVASDLRCFVQ